MIVVTGGRSRQHAYQLLHAYHQSAPLAPRAFVLRRRRAATTAEFLDSACHVVIMVDYAESAGTCQDHEIASKHGIILKFCCPLLLPFPRHQSSDMSYSKVISLVLCLQLLSYSVSAQNAAAGATAASGTTPSPAAAGSTSYATVIATALSSGDAQAAANAIAAAQSAGQSSAYAAAFSQVSPTQQSHVLSYDAWQAEQWAFVCNTVHGLAGQVIRCFSLGSRTSTRSHPEDQQRSSNRSSVGSCQRIWSSCSFATPSCCERPSCCDVAYRRQR